MIHQLLPALMFFILFASSSADALKEVHHWKTIDIAFPSESIRQDTLDNNGYIPINNIISSLKVWKDRIYLTLPRWKPGVPVTLGTLPTESTDYPQIEAYPSFDMQTVGDCSCFQFIQGLEIDTYGRLWLVDSGRTETLTEEPKPQCAPRLIILDLETNQIVRAFEFPAEVTPVNDSLLTDLVLDSTDGGFAYIADFNQNDPGIIVYSLSENRSWKVRHHTMRRKASSAEAIVIDNQRLVINMPMASIALSPVNASERFVYYTSLASQGVFKVPTSVLKNRTTNLDLFVREIIQKTFHSQGMVMEADGMMYLGSIEQSAIVIWDTNKEQDNWIGQHFVRNTDALLKWPSNLAIDDKGYLWVITNSFHHFVQGRINSMQFNYRIVRSKLSHKNYQYFQDGSKPELLETDNGATSASQPASAVTGGLLTLVIGLGTIII